MDDGHEDPEFETYAKMADFLHVTMVLYIGPILFVLGNVLNTLSVIVLQSRVRF